MTATKVIQIFFKFHSNLLKVFSVDLKACLGLVVTALLSSGKIEAGFWVMLFRGQCLLLCGGCYTILSYYMIKNTKSTELVLTLTQRCHMHASASSKKVLSGYNVYNTLLG